MKHLSALLLLPLLLAQCTQAHQEYNRLEDVPSTIVFTPNNKSDSLALAAVGIIDANIKYVPDYRNIAYPNGDVPAHTGVCADVVVRAFRKIGIDLQQKVHEDMRHNFSAYPKKWGLSKPDANIDHRRVPNLMTYFARKGWSRSITQNAKDYKPGDVVAWRLPGNLTHIGIVSYLPNATKSQYLIVHNIGGGQVAQDCLFSWEIIGHYRVR